jgi:hypothetical protein
MYHLTPTCLRHALPLLSCFFILNGCKEDSEPLPEPFKLEVLNGYVQKGPFAIGSNLSVNELNTNFAQTGRLFNTNIQDNTGRFELKSLELVSPYAEIRASGFYFDEVEGALSAAPLQLNALADLSKGTSLNVNVLSHLEESRARVLLDQKVAFLEAKRRAQQEVLAVFEIKPAATTAVSELLDIAADGADNAALLAVSVIVQAGRNVGELSELLAALRADLKPDGILNDPALGSQLVNGVKYLDLAKVRKNLERRYSDLKLPAKIPAFEPLIEQFLKNTKFPYTFRANYPKEAQYGTNVLALPDSAVVRTDRRYSFAVLAAKNVSVMVRVTLLTENPELGYFGNPLGENFGWSIQNINGRARDIVAVSKAGVVDMSIVFSKAGRLKLEFFENGASQPVETKHLFWGIPDPNIDLFYPSKSDGGFTNILTLPYSNSIASGRYSLVVDLPKQQEKEIVTRFAIDAGVVEVDKGFPADWTVTQESGKMFFTVKGKNKRAQITLNLPKTGGFMYVTTSIDGTLDLSLDKKITWQ